MFVLGGLNNGFLILNEVPLIDNIWMLATGTAIGPYLSILKTPDSWSNFKKVYFIL